jgi:hypothetical protein
VKTLVLAAAVLIALALAPAGFAASPVPWCGTDQTPQDRLPEAVAGPQVHLVYATPADGADAAAQWAGQMVGDMTEVDSWWRGQDPTRTPRFDVYPFAGCAPGLGALDISDVRLAATGEQVRPFAGRFGRLVTELRRAFSSRFKKYIVYYDGPVEQGAVCGQGGGDFDRGPSFAIVYLHSDCTTKFQIPTSSIAAHEFLHALGALPDGAPSACPDDPGHPCGEPTDILNPQITVGDTLASLVLDVGRDDYYGHSGTWPDIQDSGWLFHIGTQTELSVAISGAGTVESAAPGLVCPSACTTTWDTGSVVALLPSPADGQRFDGWTGACAGFTSCDVTLNGPRAVTARFVKDIYRLQVKVTGKGKVTGAGLSCPSRCAVVLASGSLARLTATPAKGWKVKRWSGPCSSAARRCSAPVTSATTARLAFVRLPAKKQK